jgi:hypothetical protein
MRLTIVPEDSLVIVDGVPVSIDLLGFSELIGVHAVQWYGSEGEIEFKDGGVSNSIITDVSPYMGVVDAHGVEVVRLAEAAEAQAILDEPRFNRDDALEAIVHDFGDGRIIQARESDETNLRNSEEMMIRRGMPSMVWVMADNLPANVTPADLRTAIESGQDQAATIWDKYITDLKTITK